MSFIATLEGDFSKAAKKIVSFGKTLEFEVLPALKKVEANATTIETVTGFVSKPAAAAEVAAFNILGLVISAIEAAGSAAGEHGVNITLDQQAVKDIQAIIPAVKAAL